MKNIIFAPMKHERMNVYLDKMGGKPLLTDEEERQLAARVAEGDEHALSQLVEANQRFVVSMAQQYEGHGVDIEDLVTEGNIALIAAAHKFDGSRGARFVAYAAPFLRQRMEREVKRESARERVESGPGGQTRSVDAPLGHRPGLSLLSVIADGEVPFADERVHQAAAANAVMSAMETLNARELQVVNACFGLNGEVLTMAETAEDMGLARERVRDVRKHAVRKLKKAYKAALNK